MQSLDLLAHFSNLLMLVSYSLRSMLWLRWFAVASAITVIPYYLLQSTTLWPPVFWACVFTAINLLQIGRIYAERRPVVFSADEQALYQLGFQSLPKREFLSLVLAGEWRDAAPGERLIVEGQPVEHICIPIAGAVRVERGDRLVTSLAAGHVVGTALAFTGDPSPLSASFAEPGRYICWRLTTLRAFLDRKPELRAALQKLVNSELARKVEGALSLAAGSAVDRR